MAGDDSGSHAAATAVLNARDLQEGLHTLGNALAQVKMGNLLMARGDLDHAGRLEVIEEMNRSIADAESVYRFLSAQLR